MLRDQRVRGPGVDTQHHPKSVGNAGSPGPPRPLKSEPQVGPAICVFTSAAGDSHDPGLGEGSRKFSRETSKGSGRGAAPQGSGLCLEGQVHYLAWRGGALLACPEPSRPLRWWGMGIPLRQGLQSCGNTPQRSQVSPTASTKGPAWEPGPRWGSGGWRPPEGQRRRKVQQPRCADRRGPLQSPSGHPDSTRECTQTVKVPPPCFQRAASNPHLSFMTS